jgi:ADP-L-glycero-D-manno-heptose 6-epimerase
MSIVVTGAAGFIGSCLVSFLNDKGIVDIILVDDFSNPEKQKNINLKNYITKIHRNDFFENIDNVHIDGIFHIGARTDTTEMNVDIFDHLNLRFSKRVWQLCVERNIPLIYASSAATYGDGANGFDDDERLIPQLKPLNPYGQSKQEFDFWALSQEMKPPHWVGLKFFNVFGPNEYHKNRMASVVFHAYHQIKEYGKLKLFQSHRLDYQNGEQIRDFIYIKDLLSLLWFWYENSSKNGIFNAGTGKARTFNDLGNAIFSAMNINPNIEYILTPLDIRDKYQYFTEARMERTRNAGYNKDFLSLEDGVKDYITNYLNTSSYL